MDRRTFLQMGVASIAVVGSGCAESLRSGESSPASASPTSTGSPPVIECDNPRQPAVPTVTSDDRVEPKSYPEKPATLTLESVKTYVRAFERAYIVNQAIREYDLVRFDFLSWGVEKVSRANGGILVYIGGDVAPLYYRGTETETTPYHSDDLYMAAFLATERGVLRAAQAGTDPPDPRSGELVVCTPAQ